MKLACACLFVLIVSLSVFTQNDVQISNKNVEYKGFFDLENPVERIRTYKFIENNKFLLLVGDRTFQLWDLEDRKVLKTYPNKIGEFQKGGPWVLSPDGKKLLAFNNFTISGQEKPDPFASVWDAETGEKLFVIDKEKYPESGGRWSKNGKIFLTTDNSAFFLSDYLFTDRRDNNWEGIPIISYLGDSRVSFWDGETFEHRADISLSNVSWYYLSPDGETLFTTQGEKKKNILPYSSQKADYIDVWNTKTGKLKKQIPIGDDVFFVRTRKNQVSPDGKHLALIQKSRKSDSADRLLIWELDNIDAKPKFTIKANPVISDSDLIYSPDGKYVAMEAGSRVQIYELATGKKTFELKKTEMPDLWLADNMIAIDIDEKKLKAFDILADKEIYQKRLSYEDYETTNYSGVPDADGRYPTETEVINFTRFAVRKKGSVFLMYDNSSLEIVNSLNGMTNIKLITPKYNLKKKKYDNEKLISTAGWTDDGKYIYALTPEKTAMEIWKYLD